PASTVATGSPILFRLHYHGNDQRVKNALFRILIKSVTGQVIVALVSGMSIPRTQVFLGSGTIDCQIDKLPLNTGRYLVDLEVTLEHELADMVHDTLWFDVVKGSFYPTGDLPGSAFPVLIDY